MMIIKQQKNNNLFKTVSFPTKSKKSIKITAFTKYQQNRVKTVKMPEK